MKTIFILVTMLDALLLSGCSLFEDKEKALEIVRLQTELASQHGTRAAEIEYGERQVSFYLGCKEFFNRCSKETIERGEKLLQNGYTGTTSHWYWAGLIGELTCIAIATAIFITIFMNLYLRFIAPSVEKVEQAQELIDGVDEYILEGRRRKYDLEEKMLAEKSVLTNVIHEIRKKDKERKEVSRALMNAYGELRSVQEQLMTAKKSKNYNNNFSDY